VKLKRIKLNRLKLKMNSPGRLTGMIILIKYLYKNQKSVG
jgi:hypothetical protein